MLVYEAGGELYEKDLFNKRLKKQLLIIHVQGYPYKTCCINFIQSNHETLYF